ncbi:sterol desaturase family protein [Cypionkella psychrotolerans]|uniref:sterol desaturase family protein n=1 Tax=Cypionkella psychrotolerans TaxID=1678131 RepID=UPI0006B641D1|nr:sterol desaturase family protein [Cypionkella psychrotolerans]
MDPNAMQTHPFWQSVRKAKTRILQMFSAEMPAWMFFLDFLVYPPLILLCVVLAFGPGGGFASGGLIALGILGWSLAEYLIHRFAFHHAPLLQQIHLAHHAAPRELQGTPMLVTLLVFYGLVYWPLTWALRPEWAAAVMAGVLFGYLGYISVHYVVHHLGSGGRAWLRRLIRLHAVHHHDVAHNFGVTSPLWDWVFGTLARR